MTAFLLCVTALISYSFGSLSTPILSSHIFFHENILNYSRDNVGITRFLKHHGWKGVAKLLVIEVFKVIIPVSIGGLLMLIVGHADVGFAFALFCVVLGTIFPILYRFRGEPSLLAVAIGSFFLSGEVAFAGVIVFAVVYIVSRYVSLRDTYLVCHFLSRPLGKLLGYLLIGQYLFRQVICNIFQKSSHNLLFYSSFTSPRYIHTATCHPRTCIA